MRHFLLRQLVDRHHPPRPPLKVTTWTNTTPVGKTSIANHVVRTLFNLLERQSLPKSEPGDFAEFVDENDPEQGVVLRRKNGAPALIMPLDVWDAARTGRSRTDRPNLSSPPR